MGSRAHYAIVRDGKAQLRYSHWGAQHVDADMLWGPEVVIPFIEGLDPDDPAHVLLDATWSEGAVLVDVDRKTFMVSGGETIGPDPELRRLWLQLAKAAWKGWNVSWADHGIAHVVDALGVDRSRVLGKLQHATFDPSKLYTCHTQGRARMLLSIRDERGLEHYGFDAPVEYYLVAGPQLIDCLHRCRIYSVDDLEKGQKLPEDAIYIDALKRRLVVTLAPVFGFYDARIVDLTKSHWPDWTVDMNYEGLRQHPAIADLDFRIPERDRNDLLQMLRNAVCIAPPQPAPAKVAGGTRYDPRTDTPKDQNVLPRHKSVPLSSEERLQRFEALVRELQD